MAGTKNAGKLIKSCHSQQEASHRPQQPQGLVVSWALVAPNSLLGLYSHLHLWVGVFLVDWKTPAGWLLGEGQTA